MIAFEACLNFRDLGGYATADGRRVRTGRLFRSMTPEFMTEADLRCATDDLGVRLVIDLRNAADRDSGPIGEPPRRRHVLGFVEMADFDELRELPPEEALPLHLDLSSSAIAEAIDILSDGRDGAALFHCQTGKDRTGVLAAVLLRALGVSEEDVMADYLAGVPLTAEVIALLAANGRPMSPRAPLHAREPSKEEAMRAFLKRLEDEFGGARSYLLSHGVRDDVLENFVTGMLE